MSRNRLPGGVITFCASVDWDQTPRHDSDEEQLYPTFSISTIGRQSTPAFDACYSAAFGKAPGSSRPAKRCRACAIFSRPPTAVAITSTMVKDEWKWPRACTCSTGTPAAAGPRRRRCLRRAMDRTRPSRRTPAAGPPVCRAKVKRADRCGRPARSRGPRTGTSASVSGNSPSRSLACRRKPRAALGIDTGGQFQ